MMLLRRVFGTKLFNAYNIIRRGNIWEQSRNDQGDANDVKPRRSFTSHAPTGFPRLARCACERTEPQREPDYI
jgi:hypothetical protein